MIFQNICRKLFGANPVPKSQSLLSDIQCVLIIVIQNFSPFNFTGLNCMSLFNVLQRSDPGVCLISFYFNHLFHQTVTQVYVPGFTPKSYPDNPVNLLGTGPVDGCNDHSLLNPNVFLMFRLGIVGKNSNLQSISHLIDITLTAKLSIRTCSSCEPIHPLGLFCANSLILEKGRHVTKVRKKQNVMWRGGGEKS